MQGFEGATVNQPITGFHKRPVAVLDWMSLYPSVMCAHNLCYSTMLIPVERGKAYSEEEVETHEISDALTTCFVRPAKHRGILPRIIEGLLAERKIAKKQIKVHAARAAELPPGSKARTAQEELMRVFDGKQLALKTSVNSAYGMLGASGASGSTPTCTLAPPSPTAAAWPW